MRKLFGGLAVLVLAFTLTACGGNTGPTTVGTPHTITVDDTQSLTALIDAGHYDSVNDDINSTNFSITGKGKRDEQMVLVSFNRSISSEDADAGIRARGYRPANLDECLAYGASLAKARQDFGLAPPNYWIVCLGQSAQVDGYRNVPELWSHGSDWGLGRNRWDGDWRSDGRFLAVRT